MYEYDSSGAKTFFRNFIVHTHTATSFVFYAKNIFVSQTIEQHESATKKICVR